MNVQKKDVLILGGGIIGVSIAHALQKEGRSVTVLDKNTIGHGCSYGNAGWITPCFAMPLPQPGMFFKSLKWLCDSQSPLYIKPEPSITLLRWLTYFARSMTQKKMQQSIEALTDISKESLLFYKNLSLKKNFGFQQKGLLMVSGTQEGLASALQEMQLMEKRNIRGQALSQKEVLSLEPSLKENVLGGVYFPEEAHAEPLLSVQAIAQDVELMGGEFISNAEVYDLKIDSGSNRISQIVTTRGVYEANLIVVAMGTWSETLAKKLRVTIPILGGKGYSLILTDFGKKPEHPIMIIEKKIAITPRSDSVRVAGTLELVRNDLSITAQRVNAILKGAQQFFDIPPTYEIKEVWRGLRPCTPDGVPMIGFSKKYANLFFCTGHQMLGLQSAPGSGKLAAQMILNQTPYTNPKPFDPNRF